MRLHLLLQLDRFHLNQAHKGSSSTKGSLNYYFGLFQDSFNMLIKNTVDKSMLQLWGDTVVCSQLVCLPAVGFCRPLKLI